MDTTFCRSSICCISSRARAAIEARIDRTLAFLSDQATAGSQVRRVGMMASEARLISDIIAPDEARDGVLNNHHASVVCRPI